ncbi:hypothetical protein BYT27DRAFT_7208658 [Phlegmacium glaucopus]|nr:hypothetical protein BYT27DRAFT_7208658 [Phlegmacium glaucopus]
MIDGSLMPPVAKVLAATIGITFVGPRNLPERSMPSLLWVRRMHVKKALEWLKENNPLYKDITISSLRLAELPEDGVPHELLATAKHSTDISMLYAEQDGYVPPQGDEAVDNDQELSMRLTYKPMVGMDDPHNPDEEPDVVPLAHLGVVDVDGVEVTESKLMAHALANCCESRVEEDYMIRRGSTFVNEYARIDTATGQRNNGGPSNANHLLGCFPMLFPYGQGGFKVEREVNVPYEASQEETRGVPFSNPAIQMFLSLLSTVKTKIQGSDKSRKLIRGKIWGTNILHNPPSLWVTINPSDMQDPIAQVFAGVNIDLDAFCNTAGPDSADRSLKIASDPYASARFFHFIIKTILEVLVGIAKQQNGTIRRKEGIFGFVKSYIVKHFIKSTIRADIDGRLAEDIVAMHKVDAVSYSRPLDPRKPEEAKSMKAMELELARTTQLHSCSMTNCLKVVKGRLQCKRRTPFALASDDWVDSGGAWGPKRLCGFLNNWNPPLLMSIQANHDIKGVLTWYITNYASKKQQHSSNVLALLVKQVAFHNVEEKGRRDLTDEFSGPEVISYLMGWGDRFESHHHVLIYTDAIISALKKKYPGLRKKRGEGASEDIQRARNHIITMDSGVITLKDQLHEYMFHGEEIIEMSLFTFILDTYDGKSKKHNDTDDEQMVANEISRPPRRPLNRCVQYQQGFNKTGHCRIFRTEGHETLPQFMGSWMPRNDRACDREVYCAAMLALSKPWKDLSDLKTGLESFDESFERFLQGAGKKIRDIVENIQYYYECCDAAKNWQQEMRLDANERTIDFEEDACPEDLTTSALAYNSKCQEITEEDIEFAYDARGATREWIYAELSMYTVIKCGIFSEARPQTVYLPGAVIAEERELAMFHVWEEQLKNATRRDVDDAVPTLFADSDVGVPMCRVIDVGVKQSQDGSMLLTASLKDDATKNLKRRVELAVGMKAMVILNIATDAELANDLQPKITFNGVTLGIIPISPTLLRFNVEVDGQKVKIERRQIAIVPGYAFTDYKAQGQTLEYVIVDIAKPPSGSLSPFSVYVALSRSRGRKTIRILRDFDPGLFMHHPSEDLRWEMTRLEELDRSTKVKHEENGHQD